MHSRSCLVSNWMIVFITTSIDWLIVFFFFFFFFISYIMSAAVSLIILSISWWGSDEMVTDSEWTWTWTWVFGGFLIVGWWNSTCSSTPNLPCTRRSRSYTRHANVSSLLFFFFWSFSNAQCFRYSISTLNSSQVFSQSYRGPRLLLHAS